MRESVGGRLSVERGSLLEGRLSVVRESVGDKVVCCEGVCWREGCL